MKRKNNDLMILLASFLINMIILFSIPGIKMDEIIDKKLKVGLVTLEKEQKKVSKSTGKKKTVVEKKEKTKSVEVKEKKVEIAEPKEKKLSLDDLAKSISKREVEIVTTKKKSSREVESDIKEKLLSDKKLTQNNQTQKKQSENIELDSKNDLTDTVLDYNIDASTKDVILDSEIENPIGLDLVVEKSGVEGLPSGYKLGVEDGDIVAKWDSDNREPEYPEAAQLKGMQGKVFLRMQIDEAGRVSSVYIEKGSGVPEINEAIEKIARTWKIYLNKNGLNIKGNVTLEYSFKLVGTSK